MNISIEVATNRFKNQLGGLDGVCFFAMAFSLLEFASRLTKDPHDILRFKFE